jgi:hypothetical protein
LQGYIKPGNHTFPRGRLTESAQHTHGRCLPRSIGT